MFHRVLVAAGTRSGDLAWSDDHGSEAVGIAVQCCIEHEFADVRGVAVSRRQYGFEGHSLLGNAGVPRPNGPVPDGRDGGHELEGEFLLLARRLPT